MYVPDCLSDWHGVIDIYTHLLSLSTHTIHTPVYTHTHTYTYTYTPNHRDPFLSSTLLPSHTLFYSNLPD